MDYEKLSKNNRQDFLTLGHVFHNLLVFINVPKWCIKVYKDLLVRDFLQGDTS
jgi:hypothetical protein